MKQSALQVIRALKKFAHPKKARLAQRFFKTGEGEYGEGDVFWGVTMPEVRSVVKQFLDLPIGEIRQLVRSRVHEQRMVGLLLLVHRAKSDLEHTYVEYMKSLRYVNNWDLVDATCEYIVGAWSHRHNDMRPMIALARSKNLWERRIGVVSTFAYTKKGDDRPMYLIADIVLHDEQDLIQKAVGWMLREAGKRVSEGRLRKYLDRHAQHMPRTTLRYAIERLPKPVQKAYLRSEGKSARIHR
jgi:3-methyladenine DNA glycosylase AlkD